jgi:putative oxidoreductase
MQRKNGSTPQKAFAKRWAERSRQTNKAELIISLYEKIREPMNTIFQYYRATFRFDKGLEQWGGALLGLSLRAYLGWIFFKAGLAKIADWESTLSLFRDEYQVPLLSPEIAAALGTTGELVLPLLLWAGLLSRPAALGLFIVNLMAVISYPLLFTFDCPAALNDHRYWGLLLLVLAVFGPGRISVDALAAQSRQAA